MENVYSCPICGSTQMKKNGVEITCFFCKNTFTEDELKANNNSQSGGSQSGSDSQTSSGSGASSGSTGSPALGYITNMFGTVPPPPSSGGFSAPPESLLESLRRNAAINRQVELDESNSGSGNSGGGSSRRSGSGNGGSGRNNSGRGGSVNNGSDGSGRSNGGSGNSGSGGSGRSNGGSGNSGSGGGGNGSGNGNSGGSTPSDSENNVRFLDNVSLMNDIAYELVNGNANAWANIARDKGIINSKQHTEIKYIVATRNCIAHGSGDSVKITAELVTTARNYYELMRRTASQIR